MAAIRLTEESESWLKKAKKVRSDLSSMSLAQIANLAIQSTDLTNPFAQARRTMREAFRDKTPGNVYHSYLASISMMLYDEANGKSPQLNYRNIEACNEMAARLMKLIFE